MEKQCLTFYFLSPLPRGSKQEALNSVSSRCGSPQSARCQTTCNRNSNVPCPRLLISLPGRCGTHTTTCPGSWGRQVIHNALCRRDCYDRWTEYRNWDWAQYTEAPSNWDCATTNDPSDRVVTPRIPCRRLSGSNSCWCWWWGWRWGVVFHTLRLKA